MAMGTERSLKALHNFTMPGELRWGNKKSPRCMMDNSDDQISLLRRFATVDFYSSDRRRCENPVQHRRAGGERRIEGDASFELMHGSHRLGRTPPPDCGGGREFSDGGDGIAAVREKVMLDLQTAADRIKHAIFRDGFEEGGVSGSRQPPLPAAAAPSVEGQIHRPWNLRTRRAACKTPVSRFVSFPNGDATADSSGVGKTPVVKTHVSRFVTSPNGDGTADSGGVGKTPVVDALKNDSGLSQLRESRSNAAIDKSIRLRSGGGGTSEISGKRGRSKFAVALSRMEIEEDFFAMVGRRPARRPRKRAKIIQKQMNVLFPGLWLKEVAPDRYKVCEAT